MRRFAVLMLLCGCDASAGSNLKTLRLGKEVTPKTVLAPREAKLCKPVAALTVVGDPKPTLGAEELRYRVFVANPTDSAVEICLMRFSVVSSPLVMMSLSADSGLTLPPPLPEVYPVRDEKVPFETLTLPAQSRLEIETALRIPRKDYAQAKNLKLTWSVIVNHEYRGGPIALTP